MSKKYYYALTREWGQNLKESIRDYERQSKWDDMVSEERTSLIEIMAPGKEGRGRFVDKMIEDLTDEDIEVIADIASIDKDDQTLFPMNPQENLEDRIKKWLMDNECPSELFDETSFIKDADWIQEDANDDVQLWYDEIHEDNDFEIALFFGYLKYPPYNRETDKYEEGDYDHIPVEMANELFELAHQQGKAATDNKLGYKSAECIKIGEEIKAIEDSQILVSKVQTDYDEFKFHHSVSISEIPECPYCGSCFDYNGPAPLPKTTDDAFNYLLRADSDDPMATCPDCGNGGEEFAEVWIKSVGCPLPEEYLDKRLWEAMKLLAA